jgi:hypothetical protein
MLKRKDAPALGTRPGAWPDGTKESDVAKDAKNVGYDSAVGRRLHAIRKGANIQITHVSDIYLTAVD